MCIDVCRGYVCIGVNGWVMCALISIIGAVCELETEYPPKTLDVARTQSLNKPCVFHLCLDPQLVDSDTGPSLDLSDALWRSDATPSQVALLWQAENMTGWLPHTSYRWRLQFRPSVGSMR